MDDADRVLKKSVPDADKLTKATVEKGGVLALLYFDAHTKTKEKAQEIGASFVSQLLKEPGVIFAVGEIDEPIQDRDLFSTSIQVKILVSTFHQLANVCAVHSPFSIEIIQPDEITITLGQAHELLMNLSTITADYKKYIMEKLTTPEEREKYARILEKKAELGRRILERKEEKK
jgi:hypothetical protein